MTVSIECKQCGVLGLLMNDAPYKKVSGIVNDHKAKEGNQKHRVLVERLGGIFN